MVSKTFKTAAALLGKGALTLGIFAGALASVRLNLEAEIAGGKTVTEPLGENLLQAYTKAFTGDRITTRAFCLAGGPPDQCLRQLQDPVSHAWTELDKNVGDVFVVGKIGPVTVSKHKLEF